MFDSLTDQYGHAHSTCLNMEIMAAASSKKGRRAIESNTRKCKVNKMIILIVQRSLEGKKYRISIQILSDLAKYKWNTISYVVRVRQCLLSFRQIGVFKNLLFFLLRVLLREFLIKIVRFWLLIDLTKHSNAIDTHYMHACVHACMHVLLPRSLNKYLELWLTEYRYYVYSQLAEDSKGKQK